MGYEPRHILLTTGSRKSSRDTINALVVVGVVWKSGGLALKIKSELFAIELKIWASKVYALRT